MFQRLILVILHCCTCLLYWEMLSCKYLIAYLIVEQVIILSILLLFRDSLCSLNLMKFYKLNYQMEISFPATRLVEFSFSLLDVLVQ